VIKSFFDMISNESSENLSIAKAVELLESKMQQKETWSREEIHDLRSEVEISAVKKQSRKNQPSSTSHPPPLPFQNLSHPPNEVQNLSLYSLPSPQSQKVSDSSFIPQNYYSG
jgi:hypothetical protein